LSDWIIVLSYAIRLCRVSCKSTCATPNVLVQDPHAVRNLIVSSHGMLSVLKEAFTMPASPQSDTRLAAPSRQQLQRTSSSSA
jgi:hypothetical protein